MSDIFEKVDQVLDDIQSSTVSSLEELEQWRIKFLGTKNIIKPLFAEIRHVPNEEKKAFGQKLNELKNSAESQFELLKQGLAAVNSIETKPDIDLTLPVEPLDLGSRHPVTIVMEHMI